MGIKDFFTELFGDTKGQHLWSAKDAACYIAAKELWTMKYAQYIVAQRYGSLLSKCEFKTFVNNKEKKSDNYYLLNVQPNPNQTASEFWKSVVSKLINELECLIVILDNGSWFVADSFTKNQYQVAETSFTDVVIDVYGDGSVPEYKLAGTFKGENCIYIRYSNDEAKKLMSNMSRLYCNLIENVKNSGSSKLKYTLTVDTTALNGVDVDINEEIARIVDQDFDKLVGENNAIMPLLNGFKLDVLNPSNNNSQNATIASANINNMYEDIMKNVGHIYNVPASFMLGTYEESDLEDFLTFGLDDVAKLIQQAINRKHYKKKAFLDGTRVFVDTKKVKHFDMLTISDSINKLISSGVYTINELRNILDETSVDEKIGDIHWITRNYAVVGDYIQEQTNFTANDPKTHPEQYGN